jgi:hypothetical protein
MHHKSTSNNGGNGTPGILKGKIMKNGKVSSGGSNGVSAKVNDYRKVSYKNYILIYIYTVFLAVFPRHRYIDKVDTDYQMTSPYRPNNDHDENFVPVLGKPVSISAGLMP